MRNIVICSDGTGNRGGKFRGTNVWRLFNALDMTTENNLSKRQSEQIRYYDDGVGSEDLKWLRSITGALGIGISRNIRQMYTFLSKQYGQHDADQEESKIFLFGFSRGAYTIRSLAGLIHEFGIIRGKDLPPDELQRRVELTYRVYRSKAGKKRTQLAEELLSFGELKKSPIEFIGAWDTVDAIGVPVDELRSLVDFLSPRKPHHFDLNSSINNARHALSIDDERHTFHPVMWDEGQKKSSDDQTIKQVWFAGVHSNVGGGYPKDHLAYIPLRWIMSEAQQFGVKFDDVALQAIDKHGDINGKLYDSRSGLGSYYRYLPRNIHRICKFDGHCTINVHHSVLDRVIDNFDTYAPVNIPATIAIEGKPYQEKDPQARVNIQTEALGLIFWRRVIYNISVVLTLLIVLLARKLSAGPPAESTLLPISVSDLLVSLLPDAVSQWVIVILGHWSTLICLVIVLVLFVFNKYLKGRINLVGWRAWRVSFFENQSEEYLKTGRSNAVYKHLNSSALKITGKMEDMDSTGEKYRIYRAWQRRKWMLILFGFAFYLWVLIAG